MRRSDQVTQLAQRILDDGPDPAVRLRLLSDVLRLPSDSCELANARAQLATSRWVRELEREQHSDGGWGRFHSADYSGEQKTNKTEAGVERALALGLDASHPILARAVKYISGILRGTIAFPDRAEKNERWATGYRLFAAATLARIQPDLPILDEVWDLWAEIARRTFASGQYDAEAERRAHRELTGICKDLGYLVLHNKYSLALLASRADRLPRATERALAAWAWHKESGLVYLSEPLFRPPASVRGGRMDRWVASHELMAAFPSWRRLAGDAIEWLWARRNAQGLWDFGPGIGSPCLPLSGTWRKRGARQRDWSTRILVLLAAYHSRGMRPTHGCLARPGRSPARGRCTMTSV